MNEIGIIGWWSITRDRFILCEYPWEENNKIEKLAIIKKLFIIKYGTITLI